MAPITLEALEEASRTIELEQEHSTQRNAKHPSRNSSNVLEELSRAHKTHFRFLRAIVSLED